MLFNSFDGFATHLRTKVIPAIRSAAEESLPEMGNEAKKEAVNQIGHYQSAIGSFPAWDSLAQATIDKKGADTPMLDSGAFRDDIEVDVDKRHLLVRTKTTKEYIAFTELGDAKMPARPVFGPAGIRSMPHNKAYALSKLKVKIRQTM